MHTLFTAYLRAHRLALGGASVREVTPSSGVSANTWRQYEAGARPGDQGLTALGLYFGCSPDKLREMTTIACRHDHYTLKFQETLRLAA